MKEEKWYCKKCGKKFIPYSGIEEDYCICIGCFLKALMNHYLEFKKKVKEQIYINS